MDEKKHRAGIAAVLSFLFNGLGQLYVGKINQGLIIMTISAISMIFIIVGAIFIGHWILFYAYSVAELILGIILFIIGAIVACIVGISSIKDAYREALK